MDSATHCLPTEVLRVCFGGALLIGGHSRRMGKDKALLPINGRSLLQHQCATLQGAGISELILSTRKEQPASIPGMKTVFDARGDVGPLAGIAAVLEAASCPIVFMLAVDMPRISPKTIQHILSQSNEDRGCVPHVHGRHEPLAAAYPRSLLPLVHNQIAAGRHALQDLVEEAIAAGQMTSLEIGDTEAGCFMNCNHPGEWQTFLARQTF
jgi:molybdopterin-guanine dinucleotide biosynthesis protein A